MPKLEIDVSEDGNVGTLPEPIQKFLDAKINEAYGKGAAKAASDAQRQIDELKAKSKLDPAERERLRTLEVDHSKLSEEIALRDKKFDEAQAIRDKRHAEELAARDGKLTETQAEIDKRTRRIQELVSREVRLAAVAAGARNESLDELQVLLGHRIGLDDALQAFVRDAQDAGKPLLDKDGKPVSIEGFVQQYVADHPHHKAAPGGVGGGARGGRSLSGQPSGVPVIDAATAAATEPTRNNLNRAFAEINKVAVQ